MLDSDKTMDRKVRKIALKQRFTPNSLQTIVEVKEYNSLDPHWSFPKHSSLFLTSTVPNLCLGLWLRSYFHLYKRVGVKARTNKEQADPLPHTILSCTLVLAIDID